MGISRRKLLPGLLVVGIAAASLAVPPVRRLFHPLVVRAQGARTIEDRLNEFTRADDRMRKASRDAHVSYPPARVLLLALKDERRLQVYAGASDDSLRFIAEYPTHVASGTLGPKLRE